MVIVSNGIIPNLAALCKDILLVIFLIFQGVRIVSVPISVLFEMHTVEGGRPYIRRM